jgi:hypothetical protein
MENKNTPESKNISMFFITGVTLTKDNLVKRNWHGSEKCCFCNNNETLEHLFFDCALAKFVWRIVELIFGLIPPKSTVHMSTTWLQDIPMHYRKLILVGAGIMCLSIWLS